MRLLRNNDWERRSSLSVFLFCSFETAIFPRKASSNYKVNYILNVNVYVDYADEDGEYDLGMSRIRQR